MDVLSILSRSSTNFPTGICGQLVQAESPFATKRANMSLAHPNLHGLLDNHSVTARRSR